MFIKIIGKPECDIAVLNLILKLGSSCSRLYTSIKIMHVPEFMKLYSSILLFTQQGLEKLNDITKVHFQRSSNHRGMEALKRRDIVLKKSFPKVRDVP